MNEKSGRPHRNKVNMVRQKYVLIRKTRMKAERDYFASKGDSDPERLEAQKARDQEFLKSLKKVSIGFIIFLIFYVLLKTVLGLW